MSREDWYDDDACIECGEELYSNESKVIGLCKSCYAETMKPKLSVKSKNQMGGVSIVQEPPSND